MTPGRHWVLPVAVLAALATAGAGAAARAGTIYGQARQMGNGFAQLYAELDGGGAPSALGISFSEAMLAGLPSEPNTHSRCFDKNGNGRIDPHGECNGDYELVFQLQGELAKRTRTAFNWVAVNWNPKGHPHPAPPPWAVPHFDFHFYLQDRESVRAIRPGKCAELIDCDDFERARKPVPARYVHPDHIDVGAAVPDMGNHLIDRKSPELQKNGPPFTRTFIYGAYDGRVTFYEPMITRAYLASRPNLCAALKLPSAWAVGAYYPTKYCIRYRADGRRFTVSLESFVLRKGDSAGSRGATAPGPITRGSAPRRSSGSSGR